MGTLSAQVDSKGPKVSIPDSWYIWEPLAIQVQDDTNGIDKVTLTIDGGEYGDRSYDWAGSVVPDDFIWDRHFGEIIAPIGDYPVTVKAKDGLGNISTALGEIVIPDPGTADEGANASAPPLSTGDGLDSAGVLAWLIDPYPLPSSGAGGSGDESGPDTAENEDIEQPASALSGPASTGASAHVGAVPSVATTEGGGTGLLWGAAALAAAASATAYGLSRRRAREEYIREMRERAAEMSSPEARQARLTSIWNAAQARVAGIRAALVSTAAAASRAMAAAAAAAIAAATSAAAASRRHKTLRKPAVHMTDRPDREPTDDGEPVPTPTYPAPTPTSAPLSAFPTKTPSATRPATITPSRTPSPSATPSPQPVLPTNLPGTPLVDPELPRQVGTAVGEFVDSYSLVPDAPSALDAFQIDYLEAFEASPLTAWLVPPARLILTIVATLCDVFRPLRGTDPTYPGREPVPGEPTSQHPGSDEVS
jgi:hypothetical protein